MRTPCCENMGQKKGPWTAEEDQILISYIGKYGHDNWRALPKQAGLLRCGKSCRLRWTNYLRPDIKRGNFSKEEEDNILKLHQILGNRWSAIATRLPGRTDNEIKNLWHTRLKKKLQQIQPNADTTILNTFTKSRPATLQSTVHAPNSAPILIEDSPGTVNSPVMVKATQPSTDDRKINEDMEFWYNLFIKAGDQAQSNLEKQ